MKAWKKGAIIGFILGTLWFFLFYLGAYMVLSGMAGGSLVHTMGTPVYLIPSFGTMGALSHLELLLSFLLSREVKIYAIIIPPLCYSIIGAIFARLVDNRKGIETSWKTFLKINLRNKFFILLVLVWVVLFPAIPVFMAIWGFAGGGISHIQFYSLYEILTRYRHLDIFPSNILSTLIVIAYLNLLFSLVESVYYKNKQFFKASRSKIIVFVVGMTGVPLIIPDLFHIYSLPIHHDLLAMLPQSLITLISFTALTATYPIFGLDYLGFIRFSLVMVVIWYLISCVIISIYNRRSSLGTHFLDTKKG